MEKEEIRIQNAIVHILDSSVGMPVLSDVVLDHGSEFGDFLRGHIFKIANSDEIKYCSFEEEETEVCQIIVNWKEDKFVEQSQQLAKILYQIMNANIDIPAADLLVVSYQVEKAPFLALLKMNYKSSYTHVTESDPWGNNNDIILQKAILPGENQRLTEAALIDLSNRSIVLIEKKYEVNGIKTNYFSTLFLKCRGAMSQKAKLDIVSKAVEQVQKKYYLESEQFEVQMEAKSIINQQLEEQGAFEVPKVLDQIFKEQEQMKEEVHEKLEKYNLVEAEVAPQNPNTRKKFLKQHLLTDTGIEIKIPMDAYDRKDTLEFITNTDGTISVLIKNIGNIISK